jgi:hypothetical protein
MIVAAESPSAANTVLGIIKTPAIKKLFKKVFILILQFIS